jgi:multidrug efflux pump subunit AcrB
MYLMGFTLNVVTLLSMSLVVGILVDDAIVEIENIMRHLREGKPPYQAAMEAADEIGLAVIATTFTLIAVFLPTAFMSGVPGKFFVQFGWTAAIAVFFSLVVARMLTPMMAAYLLRPPRKEYHEARWMTVYVRWVTWCLHHRPATLLAAAALLLRLLRPGAALADRLPAAGRPVADAGLHLAAARQQLRRDPRRAEAARHIVTRNPHVKMVYTAIGGGAAGSDPFARAGLPEVRKATLTINLTPRKERGGVKKQAVETLREALALPGVQVKVGLGGSNEKYILVLASENGPLLADHARKVERELRTIPGIGAVTSTASLTRPELVVSPDFASMADLGVSSAAIADVLRIATAGDYDQSIAKLNLAQRRCPSSSSCRPRRARTSACSNA